MILNDFLDDKIHGSVLFWPIVVSHSFIWYHFFQIKSEPLNGDWGRNQCFLLVSACQSKYEKSGDGG